MDLEATPVKNPRAVYRDLADGEGGVLLHLDSGQYHGVNEVGAIIWRSADGERTVSRIAAAVRAEMNDAPPELEEDVESFIEDLLQRDLIRLARGD